MLQIYMYRFVNLIGDHPQCDLSKYPDKWRDIDNSRLREIPHSTALR